MFRLVKNIDSSSMCPEYVDVKASKLSSAYFPGCAIVIKNNEAFTPQASDYPEFIATSSRSHHFLNQRVDAFHVTENMIFKIDYVSEIVPRVGIPVGLTTKISGMDAVEYNTNGKGRVVALDENGKYVYVKFHE